MPLEKFCANAVDPDAKSSNAVAAPAVSRRIVSLFSLSGLDPESILSSMAPRRQARGAATAFAVAGARRDIILEQALRETLPKAMHLGVTDGDSNRRSTGCFGATESDRRDLLKCE